MTTHRKAALWADVLVMALMTAMFGCTQAGRPAFTSGQAVPVGQGRPRPLPDLAEPRIVVVKHKRTLSVYDRDRLVKSYRCCTGLNDGDKQREGDKRTPEGEFVVCYKNPKSLFTLSLGLNYPNQEDAARGLHHGLIDRQQHDRIVQACRARSFDPSTWESLWKTKLGGEIMIHGAGADRRGTLGCVGMDDSDVRELYPKIPLGTRVVIRP